MYTACLLSRFLIISVFIIHNSQLWSQDVNRVLFIGNSYTQVNDLPQLISACASSTGDSIYFESNTPGGFTLQGHSTNATTLSKIAAGNWDYVVLQEQSQLPSWPLVNVMEDVYPYAALLDSLINSQNECVETVFYMTWGREDGDADNCDWWPPVCTYEGMDALLRERYLMLADSNNAIVSPVGATWKFIREYYPYIELYDPDGSHPSIYGSYAAACVFYTVILRKDPTYILFDGELPADEAEYIRGAAKEIVFDSLHTWFIGTYDLNAEFTVENTGTMEYSFSNISVNAESYSWDFGDGSNSVETNPVHVFAAPGYYNIGLYAYTNCDDDYTAETLEVEVNAGIDAQHQEPSIRVSGDFLFINHLNSPVNFSIHDVTGKMIAAGTQEAGTVIDISYLPRGVFLFRMSGTAGIKFIH